MADRLRLACVDSGSPRARAARQELEGKYRFGDVAEAEVIVALGGDGLMLHTLRQHLGQDLPIFGMNRGTVGFLMNEYSPDDLVQRIGEARSERVVPLRAAVTTTSGTQQELIALNEVSMIRQSVQSANLQIEVNGVERLDKLICDGLLLATPAGSTAYNLSARGPVIPLGANLLPLTPVSPFRPRRWGGALLPGDSTVCIRVLDADKRPVGCGADSREVRDVAEVTITAAPDLATRVLFDPGHSLEERILREQFA